MKRQKSKKSKKELEKIYGDLSLEELEQRLEMQIVPSVGSITELISGKVEVDWNNNNNNNDNPQGLG